jgi:ubiquinone/menaquinone biosynthesis C-methylase UbiE
LPTAWPTTPSAEFCAAVRSPLGFPSSETRNTTQTSPGKFDRLTFLEASAEHVPLDDASVDTVVTTWTLCTIPDAVGALREARRVLKAAGRLVFVEHGLAPERNVQKWQNGLTPVWMRITGGCHLNRPIAQIIETAGFAIETLDTGYLPGSKFLAYLSEGSARPV